MSYRWIVILLVLVGLGICWSVYTINAKHAKKAVSSYYEERQKVFDEINKALDEANKK